jgi:hypothetical protein
MMWGMWRVFASVLAISDTGSIALTSEHSDWPSERACLLAVQRLYTAPRQQPVKVGEHEISIRMTATCMEIAP